MSYLSALNRSAYSYNQQVFKFFKQVSSKKGVPARHGLRVMKSQSRHGKAVIFDISAWLNNTLTCVICFTMCLRFFF